MGKSESFIRNFIITILLAALWCMAQPYQVNAAEAQWLWPVPSSTTINQRWNAVHGGLDIGGAHGCAIVASKSGTVLKVLNGDQTNYIGYGKGVVINHGDGYYSHYAHMSVTNVSEGQSVYQGQTIGAMGATGNATGTHLHFAIKTGSQGPYGGAGGSIDNNIDVLNYIYSVTETIPEGKEMATGYDRTLPDGDYLIASAADTSLYVDIAGSDVPAAAGTNVSLYLMTKAEASPSEIFTIKYQNGFYSIMQKGTNRCLTVSGGSKSPGANVLIDSSNGSSAQKWAISDNNRNGFRLQAKCSGCSLDVAGAAITKGTNIQQNGNNDFDCQAWVFIPYKPAQPIENGRYILLSGLDNTMEVVVSKERNIHLWKADDTDSKNNAFDVVKLDNGYYKLTNTLFKNMCLDVEHAVTNYEKNIQVWTDKGSDNQQWAIIKCGDGYALISRCSGHAMDGPGISNGINIHQWAFHGQKHQVWKFVKAEYSVKYDGNGGNNAPAEQIKYYKNQLKLSTQTPTRRGYDFLGWAKDRNATSPLYKSGAAYTQDEDIVLYAVWKAEDNEKSTEPTTPPEPGDDEDAPPTASEQEERILEQKNDDDINGSIFGSLQAKAVKVTKSTIRVQWKKVKGATEYVVYGNKCGKSNRYEKLKTVKTTSYTQKKLKKGTYYKYVVVAVKGSEAIATSKTIHVATSGGKVGNSKSVKVNKKTFKIGVGKKATLKATAVAASNKLKVKKHRAIAFESSDKDIATVSKKGIIKGVHKGTCYVYAYAQNGVMAKVTVKVR